MNPAAAIACQRLGWSLSTFIETMTREAVAVYDYTVMSYYSYTLNRKVSKFGPTHFRGRLSLWSLNIASVPCYHLPLANLVVCCVWDVSYGALLPLSKPHPNDGPLHGPSSKWSQLSSEIFTDLFQLKCKVSVAGDFYAHTGEASDAVMSRMYHNRFIFSHRHWWQMNSFTSSLFSILLTGCWCSMII